jgi:hypothetical protein
LPIVAVSEERKAGQARLSLWAGGPLLANLEEPIFRGFAEDYTMSLPLLYSAMAATLLSADPPAPELMPEPREVIVEPAFVGYYRQSRYAVWQGYSPGNDGAWLPRVDFQPGAGYYYVKDGKPYNYASVYQRWARPSIQGTPYAPAPEFMPRCDD